VLNIKNINGKITVTSTV